MSSLEAPAARACPGVWTGGELVIYGGADYVDGAYEWFIDGGRYDPVADSWSPIQPPAVEEGFAAWDLLWTGEEVLVFGSLDQEDPEAREPWVILRYDPDTDAWGLVAEPPEDLAGTPIWTGTNVLMWDGIVDQPGRYPERATGYRYDPVADEWTRLTDVGAPLPRSVPLAVWADDELIVYGGRPHDNDGKRFRP